MQQEPDLTQSGSVAIPTATGYEVPEGKGEAVNRNTALLIIGQAISLVGDSFYSQTVITWLSALLLVGAVTIQQQRAASLSIAGIQIGLLLAYYLAGVLIIPFAGVFVDRWNRKVTMVVANLVQTVLALVPLAAFYATSRGTFLLTLYISYFLLTLAAGFFAAAELGAIQVIVSRRRVAQAVSAFQLLTAVGLILGIFFAPKAFVVYGAVVAISFNALSFLLSALFIFFMRAPKEAFHPTTFSQHDESARFSIGASLSKVFKDLGVGLRFAFTNRILIAIVIMLIVAEIGAGASNGLFSSFFLSNLHQEDLKLLGELPAAIAVGLLVGALVTGSLTLIVPLKFMNTGSVILEGVVLILFAFQHDLKSAVVLYLLVGLFNGIFLVSYQALVAKIAPHTLIGRVQASIAAAVALSAAIATFVIAGVVASAAASPTLKDPAGLNTQIFVVAGVLIGLGGMVGLFLVLGAREKQKEATTLVAPVEAANERGD